MPTAFKAGLCYFALTFGAGFLLGPLRIFLMVPRVGVRAAELAELPVMIVVMWLAARWTIRRFHVPLTTAPRLARTRRCRGAARCGRRRPTTT